MHEPDSSDKIKETVQVMKQKDPRKILIAGIGNKIMRDDGFGPRVIELLSSIELPGNIDLKDYGTSGIYAAFDLGDYNIAIFIDSMNIEGRSGELKIVEIDREKILGDDLRIAEFSLHEAGLEALLKLSKAIGTLPSRIILVGCIPKDISLSLELSEEVEQAAHDAVKIILDMIMNSR
ncbi:hydrogenase maturation protease [Candidatus Bathyarchaeota archaeon]|nr:hydrogenase maturation protease [Candidatus Bathyarchaeota archaeon]MBS7631568.1 hydrogenase maturation protease [Candidatus Bathyarchaeota archaeon]